MPSVPSRILACLGVLAIVCTALAPAARAQGGADIPRTPSGRPDLSGTYDTATVTPLQRPTQFGHRATLTAEEVAIIASDPDGLARTFGLAPAGSDERAAARANELEDDLNAPGPYDNPEQRPYSERCLMGFGSTAGPPMLSVLYNNG